MNSPITANTTLAELVDFWLQRLRADGRLENTTINEYERVLCRLVVPELGSLHLHALTTDRINTVLADLATQSVNRQRKAKVVTGAMLDVAVACGALASNPVRGSMTVSRPRTEAQVLTQADLETVRAALCSWTTAARPGPRPSVDMSDIIDLMLATSARIGEVLALRWTDVDLHTKTLEINATIKTETGKGTYRKSLAATRTIALPEFAVTVLRRRHDAGPANRIDPVFPTRNGTWQQVTNVERRWRRIRQEAGLEWVTPHAFRNSGHNMDREA